jgi:hypothetical protein
MPRFSAHTHTTHKYTHTFSLCRCPRLSGMHDFACNNSDAINPNPPGQLLLWCPLGGTFQEVPLLLMWNSLGVSEHWGHVLGVGERKKKKNLSSSSMRKTDLTWKEHRFSRLAKPSRSTTELVSVSPGDLPYREQDNWYLITVLGKIFPVYCLSFSTSWVRECMLSLKDGIKSFIDLLSQ